jgi:hypothetical protein
MSFIASIVNRHGYPHAFCKTSNGHYYMGGPTKEEVVFVSIEEFNEFVEYLKQLKNEDPAVYNYDINVFGFVDGRVQFDLITSQH